MNQTRYRNSLHIERAAQTCVATALRMAKRVQDRGPESSGRFCDRFKRKIRANIPNLWWSGWSFFQGNQVPCYPRPKSAPITANFWLNQASFSIANLKILSNLYNVTQKCNASNLNGSWNALNQVLSFSQSFRNRCKKGLRNQPCQHSQRFRNVRSSCSPSIQLQACINLFEFARFQFEAKLSSPAGA